MPHNNFKNNAGSPMQLDHFKPLSVELIQSLKELNITHINKVTADASSYFSAVMYGFVERAIISEDRRKAFEHLRDLTRSCVFFEDTKKQGCQALRELLKDAMDGKTLLSIQDFRQQLAAENSPLTFLVAIGRAITATAMSRLQNDHSNYHGVTYGQAFLPPGSADRNIAGELRAIRSDNDYKIGDLVIAMKILPRLLGVECSRFKIGPNEYPLFGPGYFAMEPALLERHFPNRNLLSKIRIDLGFDGDHYHLLYRQQTAVSVLSNLADSGILLIDQPDHRAALAALGSAGAEVVVVEAVRPIEPAGEENFLAMFLPGLPGPPVTSASLISAVSNAFPLLLPILHAAEVVVECAVTYSSTRTG